MDNTIIQQGRFFADGTEKILEIRSDVDWMTVHNLTEAAIPLGGNGVKYYWQRGLTDNDGFVWQRNAGGTADLITTSVTLAVDGFSLIDSSGTSVGTQRAVTATTNATQPVVSAANTAGLATGSVVRLSAIAGAGNISGIDFEIDTVVAGVSFRVRRALANAPGVGGAGFYRQILFPSIYYPRRRFAVNISQAASAVITTSVQHSFTVGQEVRFIVPPEFGMVELDGLAGTITAVTAATLTVDIDTSAFTAFVFPLNAALPFTFAQVVPMGEDTATALASNTNILDDATINTAFIGMRLGAGATSPGGSAGDEVYWVAGKSFSVSN